jgi:hypothetical protein
MATVYFLLDRPLVDSFLIGSRVSFSFVSTSSRFVAVLKP